jgi:serine/threonine-protein kinase
MRAFAETVATPTADAGATAVECGAPLEATLAAPAAATGAPTLAATMAAPQVAPPDRAASPASLAATRARTVTVLPRIELDEAARPVVVVEEKPRYEEVKTLGAEGMGEVALVRDHDIGRTVALKRMLPEVARPATLARFVDEVRTIGALEHPGIVPVHDVGIDERGRYFFVMKYVEGETLEHVIERLRAGDAAYHARYTIEERTRIFTQLLQALDYAHARGIVHRDLKPANVMVGRYGEVVLMDWGIAKRVGTRDLAPQDAPVDAAGLGASAAAPGDLAASAAARSGVASDEVAAGDAGEPSVGARAALAQRRALSTQAGQILGTPAYMSPEQARGQSDRVDARSDLYSAVVLFHELLTLRHYLEDRTSLPALLQAVVHDEPTFAVLQRTAPGQRALPPELVHLVRKGLHKDPAQRYQSAGELLALLHDIAEGRVPVQCHATMTKRMFREMGRFTDRHPNLAFVAFVGGVAMLLAGTATLAGAL